MSLSVDKIDGFGWRLYGYLSAHYSNVTERKRRLKSPAIRLFVQQLDNANNKETNSNNSLRPSDAYMRR